MANDQRQLTKLWDRMIERDRKIHFSDAQCELGCIFCMERQTMPEGDGTRETDAQRREPGDDTGDDTGDDR